MSDQVSSLERDIEETRERLAATLDELTYRIKPTTIAQREVAAVRGYFVDAQGAPRQDHIIKVVGGVVALVGVLAVIRYFVGD